MKKLKTKLKWTATANITKDGKVVERWVYKEGKKPIKYPTKRQIWFKRNENLLMAIGGLIVAGLCVLSYAYFMKG